MDHSVVVLRINDGAETRLQDPLELSDGDVLLVLEARRVSSPSCAIASTIHIGSVLGSQDVGVAD